MLMHELKTFSSIVRFISDEKWFHYETFFIISAAAYFWCAVKTFIICGKRKNFMGKRYLQKENRKSDSFDTAAIISNNPIEIFSPESKSYLPAEKYDLIWHYSVYNSQRY